MFGYTVPSYGRLSPADLRLYRKYYCEGCHQLRDGFGLRGALTVNFDMTFNTILLNGIVGDVLEFEGTEKTICVLDHAKADSDLMRKMAAYTLILTKWEQGRRDRQAVTEDKGDLQDTGECHRKGRRRVP